MSLHLRRFDEHPDAPYRMGRHQLHDPRSRAWDAVVMLAPNQRTLSGGAKPLGISVEHTSHVGVWDQGQVGSCTANAALGVLMTDPLWRDGWLWGEADAQALYHLETTLDDSVIPGQWPPTDTGSTGLWSMQALQREGVISNYVHCFGLESTVATLENQPVSVGMPWYYSMFTPDPSTGAIPVVESSGVAGGHQVALVGVDATHQRALVRNSWGLGWGLSGHGWLPLDDLDRLLGEGGDVVTPVVDAATAALVQKVAGLPFV